MGSRERSVTSPRVSNRARCFGSFFRSGSAQRRIHSNCEGSSGAGDLCGLSGPSGKWVIEQDEPYVLPRKREGSSANNMKNVEHLSLDDALLKLRRAKIARRAKRAHWAEQLKQMQRRLDALVGGSDDESNFANSRSDALGVECAYEANYADFHSSEWPYRVSL
eukprot:TRINITY_DN13716_c1_g6_i1.p1 TRINITY_DN13716_c1_g6~~TRINITY_DN13716_c1_g6_i1.p1  ORF type:complete len:164 (+),score=3.53 TRINITY_DN13716_c1_g6_i1:144-635(+)